MWFPRMGGFLVSRLCRSDLPKAPLHLLQVFNLVEKVGDLKEIGNQTFRQVKDLPRIGLA